MRNFTLGYQIVLEYEMGAREPVIARLARDSRASLTLEDTCFGTQRWCVREERGGLW